MKSYITTCLRLQPFTPISTAINPKPRLMAKTTQLQSTKLVANKHKLFADGELTSTTLTRQAPVKAARVWVPHPTHHELLYTTALHTLHTWYAGRCLQRGYSLTMPLQRGYRRPAPLLLPFIYNWRPRPGTVSTPSMDR
jgi:hypothetical protein